MKNVLLVFLGGGLGSIARYGLGLYLNSSQSGIPYGTFLANVLGSLLIGIILGFAARSQGISDQAVLLLATGFCGGFTTFSTFAYENHVLLKSGDLLSFGIYAIGSFVLGFASVFLGIWLVRFF
ncbi:fluoride efflux transporter CrcB [Aureitalea marina]|uniref:Fluoride-specific ion channel FluC n=1 Tax=Aureitalea marina TaxID=930804 RepID=A0A2S7KMJ1_9FLAO|nr:fluoride efflux transporter CrcB [Aureitalea marina]PQB03822.1 protein CrcB [Aureitalea marina]